jgi:hypothetical protein
MPKRYLILLVACVLGAAAQAQDIRIDYLVDVPVARSWRYSSSLPIFLGDSNMLMSHSASAYGAMDGFITVLSIRNRWDFGISASIKGHSYTGPHLWVKGVVDSQHILVDYVDKRLNIFTAMLDENLDTLWTSSHGLNQGWRSRWYKPLPGGRFLSLEKGGSKGRFFLAERDMATGDSTRSLSQALPQTLDSLRQAYFQQGAHKVGLKLKYHRGDTLYVVLKPLDTSNSLMTGQIYLYRIQVPEGKILQQISLPRQLPLYFKKETIYQSNFNAGTRDITQKDLVLYRYDYPLKFRDSLVLSQHLLPPEKDTGITPFYALSNYQDQIWFNVAGIGVGPAKPDTLNRLLLIDSAGQLLERYRLDSLVRSYILSHPITSYKGTVYQVLQQGPIITNDVMGTRDLLRLTPAPDVRLRQYPSSSVPAWAVYPQPALNQVHVKVPSADRSDALQYRVYSAAGKLLKKGKLLAGHRTFGRQGLPNGLYRLELRQGGRSLGMRPLLLR